MIWIMVGGYTMGLLAVTVLVGEAASEARAAGSDPPSCWTRLLIITAAIAWPLAGFAIMLWLSGVVIHELLTRKEEP